MILNSQKDINTLLKSKFKSILLVDPYVYKYVSLGLIKLYTYFHNIRDIIETDYRLGSHKFEDIKYDVIFIASGEFSYYHNQLIKTVRFYKREYPESKIVVGGVYCITNKSVVDDLVFLGCDVIDTNIDILDNLDFFNYSLFDWNPWEFIFTTRGCKMKCSFCYVKKIEPKSKILPSWNSQLMYSNRDNIMIHDNNIISFGEDHFKKVVDLLIQLQKPVMFDNGFDCRFWNKKYSNLVRKLQNANLLSYSSIRFAFDSANQDGKIQNALLDVKKYHPIDNVLVYVLVNFKDSFEECFFRAFEIAKIGAYPFIQYYTPLDWIGNPEDYKSATWSVLIPIMKDYFNNKEYKKCSFDKYKQIRGL